MVGFFRGLDMQGGGVFEAVDMMENSLVGSNRSLGISKAIQVYLYIYMYITNLYI